MIPLRRFIFATLLLLTVSAVHAQGNTSSKVSVSFTNASLSDVLWSLESQADLRFIVKSDIAASVHVESINMQGASVTEVLDAVLAGSGLEYKLVDNTVTIVQKAETAPVQEKSRTDEAAPAPAAKERNLGNVPGAGANPQDQARAATGKKITIKGHVMDKSGQILPGAVIIEVGGNNNYTSANDKGDFTLTIREDSEFDVMFQGLKSQRVAVRGRKVIDIVMAEETQTIESAVVTGYGTIAKESYTGSAITVGNATFEDKAIGVFEESIRDNVVGALAVTAGQPGDPGDILLRGFGSLEESNQPLFVVDGVVWEQENASGSENITDNPLTALNSSDIESFTVLKDAASAALYGSRGANGVIVITTKQGKSGEKMRIDFRTINGVSRMTYQPNLVNADEYAELWVEGEMHRMIRDVIGRTTSSSTTQRRMLVEELYGLYGDKTGYTFDGKNFYAWQKLAQQAFNTYYVMPAPNGSYTYYDYFGDDHAKLPNVDWYDAITRTALYTKNTLQVSGGFANIGYYASMEYLDQQGAIKNSSLERYAFRMKLNQNSKNKKFNWSLNNYIAHSTQEGPLYGGTLYMAPMYAANIIPPVVPAYLEDGSYNLAFPNNLLNSNNNPLATADLFRNRRPAITIQLNGNATYKIANWLKWENRAALRWNQVHRRTYYDSSFGGGYMVNGRLYERYNETTKLTAASLLHIDKKFGKKHTISATAGVEMESVDESLLNISAQDFADDSLPYVSGSSSISEFVGEASGTALLSYLSTGSYTYRQRYTVGASFRRDYSSRFAPEYRAGNFWSVSGAYDVSKEKFMRKFRRQINMLKFKGSYGINGSQPSARSYWRNILTATRYDSEAGIISTYRPRPDLTWEGNRIWNAGVDAAIFGNRVTFSAEFFQRKSNNLLRYELVSETSGYRTMLRNTEAGIDNRGFEFTAKGSVIQSKNLKWNIDLNLSTLSSVYYGLDDSYLDSYQRQVIANGLNVHTWYVREFAGIDPESGSCLYWRTDENGNRYKSTSSGPYQYDKQGVPKVYGSIKSNLKYNRFTFDMSFTYGLGHYIFDMLGASYHNNDGSRGTVMDRTMLDRWTPDHTDAKNPLRINAQSRATNTTRYLYKGDYLKLKSARLSYSAPGKFTKLFKASAASVYVQAENAFILCALKNYDPEMTTSGYRHVDRYPTAATYTVGVSVRF